MTRNWCVLLLVLVSAAVNAAGAATATVDGDKPLINRGMRDRDSDSYRDSNRDSYRDRDHNYNRGYNNYNRYGASEARSTLEKANAQIRDNIVTSLEGISKIGLVNQDQVSDAILTITKSLRRNPSQMSDVMANLPRLIVLDGNRQFLEVLRVLSNSAVNSNSNYREASDLITEALRGRRRNGYDGDNNNWGTNIFGGGGFNNVFRNLMDSVYNSVRPFNNNNWRYNNNYNDYK